MSVEVVFIHGAGQAGADAWPQQAAEDEGGWFFMLREGVADDAHRDARRILDHLRDKAGGHVVAHSYGANAALLAAQEQPDLVHSLTLLEPACFDLARGQTAVEEHIAAMRPVFEVADAADVSTRDFSLRFAAGMGFDAPDLPDDVLEERVSRLRAMRPPWDVGLRGLSTKTLVITGGERPLYEETAESLENLGAEHRTFNRVSHRVQDDPRATPTLRKWFSEQR